MLDTSASAHVDMYKQVLWALILPKFTRLQVKLVILSFAKEHEGSIPAALAVADAWHWFDSSESDLHIYRNQGV